MIAREFFQTGVPGSTDYAQHLVLVATFIAGGITSRQKRHLSLAVDFRLKPRLKDIVQTTVQVLCAGVTIAFSWSALSFALNGFEASQKIGVIPLRLVVLVMGLGYLVMGLRFMTGRTPGEDAGSGWLWPPPSGVFSLSAPSFRLAPPFRLPLPLS